jgi:Tfp pilus assembly protein PilF
VKLSKVYFYKKDYKNSLNELSRVQELDNNNYESYFIMGMNFKEMGDTGRALSSFQKAVQVRPDFYDAYMQLGLVSSNNSGSQAPKYFDNAIRLDSLSREAYYGKAKFYQDHEEFEKAKATYLQLITVAAQYENAYFNLGFIYIKQDSIDKAYRMFDYALKVKPTYAEAYYYRGLCSMEKGNGAQAEADFRQAISLKPGYEAAEKELNALSQNVN